MQEMSLLDNFSHGQTFDGDYTEPEPSEIWLKPAPVSSHAPCRKAPSERPLLRENRVSAGL
jgi:hypothetical protein